MCLVAVAPMTQTAITGGGVGLTANGSRVGGGAGGITGVTGRG